MPRLAADQIVFPPGNDLAARVERLGELLRLVRPVPPEWLAPATVREEAGLFPLACTRWAEVVAAWEQALRWRPELEDVLAVCCAVAVSTQQTGDQLFLQLIALPGSAKTRFCDALLVSRSCYPMEHLTGFHSGYTDGTDTDYSLIARSNGKTWITPEGDVMVASPRFPELMSQIRRIFDGASGASYKNRKEDLRYTGLRTPWIMAGTPQMLTGTDQSRLGDRFLRVYIDEPDAGERRAILLRAAAAGVEATLQTSNGAATTTLTPAMARAYQLTGGYVDHLRANAAALIGAVWRGNGDREQAELAERYADLAEFTADLRARPAPHVRGQEPECPDGKELPARLVQQYGRLALCLGAVLQRPGVDGRVLKVVAKVARDTARGRTLNVAERLYGSPDGLPAEELAVLLNDPEGKATGRLLRFLEHTGSVARFQERLVVGMRPRVRWRLTERMAHLYAANLGLLGGG